jgi:outer membrane protein assembly factor BamB
MVIAVSPDGTLKWRHQLDGTVKGSPAFIPQYVGTEPTATPTSESTPNATPEVTNTPTPTETPLSTIEVVVYVVDEEGTVYGIRESTGLLEAKIALHVTGVSTSPVVNTQAVELTGVNPFVVFGSEDGYVYVTALDGGRPCTNSGENQWEVLEGGGARVSVGSAVRSSPAIGLDGTIYVTTADGQLHAIGPAPDATVAACITFTPTPTATRTATETPA